MSRRFRDFDSFLEEQTKEPVTIGLFDKEWALPEQASAEQILRLQRVRAASVQLAQVVQGDAERVLSDAEITEFKSNLEDFDIQKEAEQLLGRENVAAWMKDHGLTFKALASIFWWAVSVYEGSDAAFAGGEDPGEARAPKGAAQKRAQAKHQTAKKAASRRSTSSKTSGRSKPTSTASTG